MNFTYIPPRITLQWHITNKCNLRCKHCYQTDYSENHDKSREIHTLVLNEFVQLTEEWRRKQPGFRAHINITGGEPFTYPYFKELLTDFHKLKHLFSYGILTNGSLITEEWADFLAKMKTGFVQVSLEGGKKTNDEIRFNGSYEQTIKAIKILKKYGLKVLVSFTVSRKNKAEFSEVAAIASKYKVNQLWTDRLLPFGNGKEMLDDCLNSSETREFYEEIFKLKTQYVKKLFNKTEITMNRALQFLCGGEYMYSCSAGDKLITIMPDGEVLPCRRMPVPCGNIINLGLRKIYYENELFQKLRNSDNNDENCKKCTFYNGCKGGLKCLSAIYYNTPFKKDPNCWK